MSGESSTRRLFFACWPDSAMRVEIIARRQLISGTSRRQVPDHNLHLTLLFLGDQPADRLADICSAADSIRNAEFSWHLDRFGWFPGARVAWLGGVANEPSKRLVQALVSSMRSLDLKFDERAFVPHITLFRQVARQPEFPSPPTLKWPIHGFSLIESIPARPYQVLRTWPLKL
jgi:2'-5' RNA ligase